MPPAWGRRPGHLYPALLSQGTPLHFIMLFITVCSYAASSLADCLSSLAEWKLHERGGNAVPMTTTSSAVHLAQEAFEELTNDNYFGLLILQESRRWFRAYHWIFNPSQPLLSSRRTVFPPDLTRPLGWQSKSLRVSRVSRLCSVLDSTAPHLHLSQAPPSWFGHARPPSSTPSSPPRLLSTCAPSAHLASPCQELSQNERTLLRSSAQPQCGISAQTLHSEGSACCRSLTDLHAQNWAPLRTCRTSPRLQVLALAVPTAMSLWVP